MPKCQSSPEVTDCFIVGFNDVDFGQYVELLRSMGTESGAYRDLNLAFVTVDGQPYRSMDLINLYREDARVRPYSNVDFLWPVITYLFTYLTRRGFSADFVNLFQEEKSHLIDSLRAGNVRSVAITTTLYVFMAPILEIVSLVREHSPSTTIIVGGPYVHNQARVLAEAELHALFDALGADVYVIGAEGEATLAEVLAALRDGTSLRGISNLAYRDGSTIVQTPEATESNPLAENMVDYDLFEQTACNGFVSVRTAKSCPFACAFCAFPTRAGGYSYLAVDRVEEELDAIHRHWPGATISFIDDTFNVPKKRFKEILRMMIRKGYGFRWNSYLRSDHADEECIELMLQSGCDGVFLGAESGSDSILKAMNKTARRADYVRVISQLREAGIVSHANLIVGFPGETEATVQETMDFIEESQPDFYRAQLWYCDPTTPVWNKRDELQLRGTAFSWTHPTMNARSAADHVDRFFRDIHNSLWLPQYGFEPWSIYYLERREMTLSQVKRFVAAFNAGVLEKLLDPCAEGPTVECLQAIREAATARGISGQTQTLVHR